MESATQFAPAQRASSAVIERQNAAVARDALLQEVLATVPHYVLVLNRERQVVFANRALEQALPEGTDFLGQRPGEIVGCVNSCNDTGGCGTSEACRTCGVVRAILSATRGEDDMQEGRLTLASGESLDLRAVTHPVVVDGEPLTVLTLTDIADEKRRRVLERVFFHDVLNTAGGVQGLVGLLRESNPDQREAVAGMLEMSAAQLVEEIQAQRLLTSVETGQYMPAAEPHPVSRLLHEVLGTYTPLAKSEGVGLEVTGAAADVEVETDATMLARVLGNLVKNALEASSGGQTVHFGANAGASSIEFWVHNESVMPQEIKLQVFQRSFSTKGEGRGLGTHSVKLFTERYLGGTAAFDSRAGCGTTFRVTIPLRAA